MRVILGIYFPTFMAKKFLNGKAPLYSQGTYITEIISIFKFHLSGIAFAKSSYKNPPCRCTEVEAEPAGFDVANGLKMIIAAI